MNKDYLRFPFDSFWVSGNNIQDKEITLGLFEDKEENKNVKASGQGCVVAIDMDESFVEIVFSDEIGIYKVLYKNVEPAVEVDDIVDINTVIGKLVGNHLGIQIRQSRNNQYFRKVNPLNHMFLYTHNVNRKNIPYSNPRKKPLTPFSTRR